MTTICYDGRELVSDSQATVGDAIGIAPFRKIHQPEEGEYWEIYGTKVLAFGLTGDAGSIEYIKDKLSEGIDHRTRFSHEDGDLIFRAIVINENADAFLWRVVKTKERDRNKTELLPMLPPVAIGSGQSFAQGVLAIGKSAKQAVKTAMRLCPYTGGALQIFEIPPKPETKSVRPTVAVTAAE